MPDHTNVLIVGAGPTGLTLAAELQRRGVACRLIDANSAPLHWDRATVVHPRSLEVFESLGLLDRFLAAGVKQKFARLHSGGNVLGEIDLSICGSRHGFNMGISEETTEAILTEYLQRHGGDVVRSARLVGLTTNDDGVVATIERDGTTEQVAADWIVGCDGIHSSTRELIGIELAGHDIPEPWAVVDVTLVGWALPYEAIYAYLDDPPVILTALPGKRWRAYIRPSSDDVDLVAEAATTVLRYYPDVRFEQIENPTRFRCHTKVAKRFRAGRVLIAGDAAHVCSPFQGHGMNTGIQDAFNLAWKLALVCRGRSDASIIDSYEAERRPVAERVAASGDEVEHAQTMTDAAERRARDASFRAVFANPTSRHHEAIAEAELDIDYGRSPIVMGDANASLGPGQRLPDTIQVRLPDGRSGGLHALAHRAGHTALVIGEDHARIADAIERRRDEAFVEATVGLPPIAPTQLGVDGATLFVVRPDGHVGLRADRDHAAAFDAYQALLAKGSR
jgi:2-polyprenyl-6-methoxyphenol hydroxylase-like FAD-dependent oxidoreductase